MLCLWWMKLFDYLCLKLKLAWWSEIFLWKKQKHLIYEREYPSLWLCRKCGDPPSSGRMWSSNWLCDILYTRSSPFGHSSHTFPAEAEHITLGYWGNRRVGVAEIAEAGLSYVDDDLCDVRAPFGFRVIWLLKRDLVLERLTQPTLHTKTHTFRLHYPRFSKCYPVSYVYP